jgi:outer membrane autotransporter protein
MGQDSWSRSVFNRAGMSGEDDALGFVIKRQQGPWLIAAAVEGGWGTFSSHRFLTFPTVATATGEAGVSNAIARLRVAYLLSGGGWYFKPSLDLESGYQNMKGFTETGAGPLDLVVNAAKPSLMAATPGFEFGKSLQTASNTVVRPFLSVQTSFASTARWTVDASFAGAPTTTPVFATSTPFPRTLSKVLAGIDVLATDKISVRALAQDTFGGRFNDYQEQIKAAVRF